MTPTAPAQQNKAVSKMDTLKNILSAPSVSEQFKNALKENSGAFVASIIDLYNGDNYLQQCNPKEVVMEALKAATLKLPINKSLGFAYIIPYNNSVKDQNGNWQKVTQPQFQLGYKGYVQLAMRTGHYRFINTDVVYEGELKQVNKLTGEIDFSGQKTSDKIVGYFAYIELLNGFSKTIYSDVEKITAHAKKFSPSFGKSGSNWTKDFDGMAMKTVLKNLLSKYGYLSVEMMDAFDSDEEKGFDGMGDSGKANSKELAIDDAQVVDEKETTNETATDNQPKPDF
ncbi:MAG TPA: recombinase [Prolixibacteraceae bacterium]|nr:recombinase [Prolixibacteraceae bacterium]